VELRFVLAFLEKPECFFQKRRGRFAVRARETVGFDGDLSIWANGDFNASAIVVSAHV